ncbi:MAG: gamma-glutamyl-gamma-aminobutyrate hydrolase family protein [Thalassobaculum sp.]|uniref:gamma-glutamyl-gamma-aminobutyrate hydrolase family protein n=1 Tax=Thalassobaculum sp. TaxID=2022740 RepID=UPI0032EBC619
MRIGITQRIVYDPEHGERRDALASDWYRFLTAVWPDVVIVPIPNLPEHAARLLEALAVEGLLLTGGNDLGTEPDRDRTESDCLTYAARHGLPVIGVCRGFQMMVAAEGGQVVRTDRGVHVATRHPVRCLSDTDWGWTGGGRLDVNSFHGFAVPGDGLPAGWSALAVGEDRTVEAARSADGRCTAVMWHPEREPAPAAADVALFRHRLESKRVP